MYSSDVDFVLQQPLINLSKIKVVQGPSLWTVSFRRAF